MRLLNIWPVIISVLICGCSIQQHTDRAERTWLKANSPHFVLHDVSLQPVEANGDRKHSQKSFFSASGASTFLRGKIQSSQIRELSGLDAMLDESDKYWAINDSGNRSQLFALDGNGKHLGVVDLPVRNRDWEDLSSYRYKGENWIAVAETGDNLQRYPVSSIYIFKQPDLSNLPSRLVLFKRIDFTYEDGPRNVESMAVSAADGKIYLIAKDASKPAIYSLPLSAGHDEAGNQNIVATKVGQLAELYATKNDVWWERWFAARVLYEATAVDISADNRTAVVANYRHVYLFKRVGSETWVSAFSRKPEVLSSHRMQQSEALAFADDSAEVIVSSEGRHALMLAIRPSGSSGAASGSADIATTRAGSAWQ